MSEVRAHRELQIARSEAVVTSAATYHKQHAPMFDNFAELSFNSACHLSEDKPYMMKYILKNGACKLIPNNKEIS